jgi:hypothetical protein
MVEVKSRKTVFIKGNVVDGRFTQDIRVGFNVDDMIVTSWSASNAFAISVFTLFMHGVGDLFHFNEDNSESIKNIFRLGKNIDGTHKFEIRDTENNRVVVTAKIIATVQFIEFHK